MSRVIDAENHPDPSAAASPSPAMSLAEPERAIVRAAQAGLPLEPRPYHALAKQMGVAPEVIMNCLTAMLRSGAVRRIAAVPNHYALGYRANGMSVWDVDDEQVGQLGRRVGALEFVSHCYRRPRALPQWRYNLFAMVHGRDRAEVSAKVARVADVLGRCARAHDVLYSTRILKKTGLRIS